MGEIDVRVAGQAEAQEAAGVLARAFHDDPVFIWLLPAAGSRDRCLRRYFVTELRHESLRHGAVEVARIDGHIVGVAAWLPPGTWAGGTQVGALPGYIRAFGLRLGVASQYMSAAVSVHPREEPHWYLAAIGVEPSWKGKGVGAALLRSRLERCDAEGVPAYLESSNTVNVPFYEHFGFQVTGALPLPQEAPVVNSMWRPVVA